jgi:hypothetical protein
VPLLRGRPVLLFGIFAVIIMYYGNREVQRRKFGITTSMKHLMLLRNIHWTISRCANGAEAYSAKSMQCFSKSNAFFMLAFAPAKACCITTGKRSVRKKIRNEARFLRRRLALLVRGDIIRAKTT